MSNEIKEKEEYEKYARDHRKELDAQEVRLGDVVTVLVGQFAGEKGVIVGIFACHNDYSDPYYEVDMNCEVPEKYKCRKTLISPNNVIGGLSAHEFKVIGNFAPKQPSMEIKQGDKVRVAKDAPRIYTPDWVDAMFDLVLKVTEVEDGNAMVEFAKRTPYRTVLTAIPTKYLVKVDAEAKEAKFKYQVGQKVILHFYGGEVSTITEAFRDGGVWNKYKVKMLPNHVWNENELDPYIEPTEQTEAEEDARIRQMETELDEFRKAELDRMLHPEKPTFEVTIDNETMNWQRYEADLAKEVALKVANKYNGPKEAAEYAVLVAKAVVEGLKRK